MTGWFTKNLDEFYGDDVKKLNGVMCKNAMNLIPRLKKDTVHKLVYSQEE
jgi:hypothetical protein